MSAELIEPPSGTVAYAHAVEPSAIRLEMRAQREISYGILHTRRSVFDADEHVIKDLVGQRDVLLVVDRTVDRLYGESLRALGDRHLQVADTIVIDGDESQKTWGSAELICQAAMNCRLSRTGVIIGVGGGIILDISGFAASIYRRGVGYLRIPTTLIGQVDVSIGIKQAVNAGGSKNAIGSFYPPLASINDASFLKTLSRPHIAAGIAEIIKMAVIVDPDLFALVEEHGRSLLASRFQDPAAHIIMMRAEASMLRELQENLFETNLQRRVDFGHTFSVVLETDSAYTLSHGFAVGLDMLISTSIAVGRGLCTRSLLDRMLALYHQVELPVSQPICSAARLHESLASVRKHRGGALNLVVPRDLGSTLFIQDVSRDELEDAIDAIAA